jgi:hypothetical protein
MIAEAIKATIPKAKRVSVDLATIRYSVDDKRLVYLTPRPAQIKLLQFDNGEKLYPFNFRLGKPSQVTTSKPRGRTSVKGEGTKVRVGGKTPPIGPLANPGNTAAEEAAVRTGRIRRYGLKAIGGRDDR